MAIAACSLFSSVFFSPGRSFIDCFTALMHLQNLVACFIFPTFGKESFPGDWIEAMAQTATKFGINRLTHARDDLCGIDQYYTQSVGPGDYMITNLVPEAKKVNPLSVEQLLIYPREGYGLNNKAIDADSILRNQPEFKNNRCIIRSQARPFLSVPYMGTGRGNPDVESLLLHSEQVRQGKECGTVTEETFEGQYVPMIPSVKDNIQNPKNLVPEVAANGWIRGGIPSRSYIRDVNC